jgi:hypothetical protein
MAGVGSSSDEPSRLYFTQLFIGLPFPLKWKDNIKMDLEEICVRMWTEFMWLRIGTGGGLS